MWVKNFQLTDAPNAADRVRLSADIHYDDRPDDPETLWFEFPSALRSQLACTGDMWLAAVLPMACKLGEPLRIDGEIDRCFAESTREIMEWWQYWLPEMHIVSIDAPVSNTAIEQHEAKTAQFFSGGVDSLFTLLRNLEDSGLHCVDDLLIGLGFDISIDNQEVFDRVYNISEDIAKRLGRTLIYFSTNIRETRFKRIPWGSIGHGSAMAAVALALQQKYRRVLIPSSDGYLETGLWGTHQSVDHFYSTTGMKVVHDSPARSRFERVELIATYPQILPSLRVCWRSQSEVNCGNCEKCLRTMIALELCDVLEKTTSFSPPALDLKKVKKSYCPKLEFGSNHWHYEEMRDQAKSRGRTELASAISFSLTASSMKQPLLWFTGKLRANRHLKVIGQPLDELVRRTVIF